MAYRSATTCSKLERQSCLFISGFVREQGTLGPKREQETRGWTDMHNDLYCSISIRKVTRSRRTKETANVSCVEKKLPGDLGVGGRIILKFTITWVEEAWLDSSG